MQIVKTPTQRQLNNNSTKVGFDTKMTLQTTPGIYLINPEQPNKDFQTGLLLYTHILNHHYIHIGSEFPLFIKFLPFLVYGITPGARQVTYSVNYSLAMHLAQVDHMMMTSRI